MRTCCLFAVLWIVSGALSPAFADDAEQAKHVKQLLAEGKFAEAEAAFQQALKEFPESKRLQVMHLNMYSSAMRARNNQAAASHLGHHLDQLLNAPQLNASMLSAYAGNYLSLTARTGQGEQGLQKVEAIIEKLRKGGDDPNVLSSLMQLQDRLTRNTDKQRAAAAQREIRKTLERIAKLYADSPDDLELAILQAKALQQVLNLAQRDAEQDADQAQQEFLKYLDELVEKFPNKAGVIQTYTSARLTIISGMARRKPLAAEAQLKELKAFLEGIDSEDPAVKRAVGRYENSFASVTRTITIAKKHLELIGKPAFALEPNTDSWANGEPLADADLQGKVVLLDFWAVWCGPCIATFPHLREWQEKYSDRGLVIVGVTRLYNYEWDAEAARATRSKEDVTPEDERAMLGKFAKHHELHHRFLVTSKASDLQKSYGVTGIPQAVLIDRQGAIQLIRVGSGASNAHDIEVRIEELLAEKPVAAK